MGRRPPNKLNVARAQLAGAKARLADQQQRAASPGAIAETVERIAELEALVDGWPER